MGSLSFTDKAQQAIVASIDLAREHSNVQTGPVHLTLALLDEPDSKSLLRSVLDRCGADATLLSRALNKLLVKLPSQDPPGEPDINPALHKILRESDSVRKTRNDAFIAIDHLIIALFVDAGIAQAFKDASISDALVKETVQKLRAGKRVESRNAEQGYEALAKYARNLTALASEGKLEPVIGRGDELRRVIRILCRKTKSNVILVGKPGTGKTAIAEALALRIVNQDVPPSLQGELWALDMGLLMAGASHKGEFEERVKAVVTEVEKSETPILLFIDEIHLLMAGGLDTGSMDAANLLKPALARGTLRCIGATTDREYKRIEKDSALERRFGVVHVEEPTVPEAISILRGLRERYELHHGVAISDEAIVAACRLAKRYLSARQLPDSALDVLDEASAGQKLARESLPEEVDRLQRRRLQLEVEIQALEREVDVKDKRFKASAGSLPATKERLDVARKELSAVDEQLGPLKAEHDAKRARGDEIQAVRQRVDELSRKMEKAQRERDLATAADIQHFALPDLHEKLAQLESKKAADDAVGPNDLVTAENIAEVISRWTGVPLSKLQANDAQQLLRLEKILAKSIVGQDEAVRAVAEAVRLSRSGLVAETRPTASFLFTGPSGSGKTELAKTLSRFLFDKEDAVVRIDGSEYAEKHAISRLIGAPPGYVGHGEGGQLTEAIKRRPYSVILIDEVEKAHLDFTTLFLQVLDNGRLTDGEGRLVDFKNTVLIFTSNVGANIVQSAPDGPLSEAVKVQVLDAVRSRFLPEFLGRLDAVVVFNRLGKEQALGIVDLRLAEIQNRLHSNGKNLKINVSSAAKDWLATHGISPVYGARPLARCLQQNLLVPLSRMLLAGSILDHDTARVELDKQRNCIFIQPLHAPHESMDVDLSDPEIEVRAFTLNSLALHAELEQEMD